VPKLHLKMKTSRLVLLVVVISLLPFVIFAGSNYVQGLRNKAVNPTRLQLATSFYPLWFFTKEIAGPDIQVTNLTPAGAEPHDYELTSQDIIQIQNSKLLIILGNLEPWAGKIKLDQMVPILEVGSQLQTHKYADEEDQSAIDPHIWLSPVLAQKLVDRITDKLVALDQPDKANFIQNSQVLKDKLRKLDASFRTGLKNCRQDKIITSHAAFGYLASEYGLTQLPITGLSPDAEPTLKELTTLASLARQKRIKYIFFESLVSPKLAQTLANEIGARTLVLNPLEGLTSDEIASGKNYITEMEQNLINLRLALGCQ
jgi:zinc transport system substrate-binding protein